MQKKSDSFAKKQYEKYKDIRMIDGYIFSGSNKLKEEIEEDIFYLN